MTTPHLIHRSTERLADAGEKALDETGVAAAVEQGELVHGCGGGSTQCNREAAGAFWQGEVCIPREQQSGSAECAAKEFNPVRWHDFLAKLSIGNNGQLHSARPFWLVVAA